MEYVSKFCEKILFIQNTSEVYIYTEDIFT
jgi:uncharacterized protein YerC